MVDAHAIHGVQDACAKGGGCTAEETTGGAPPLPPDLADGLASPDPPPPGSHLPSQRRLPIISQCSRGGGTRTREEMHAEATTEDPPPPPLRHPPLPRLLLLGPRVTVTQGPHGRVSAASLSELARGIHVRDPVHEDSRLPHSDVSEQTPMLLLCSDFMEQRNRFVIAQSWTHTTPAAGGLTSRRADGWPSFS